MTLINKFLDYLRLERNLSPLTVTAYGHDLEQWEQFLTGGKQPLEPASVTASDVRAWMADLSARSDGLRTVRRKVQAVRAFYRYLMRRGLSPGNPAADVELARLPKRLPHYMRPQVMDEALDAPVDEQDFTAVRDRLMVMMLYETGLRRAELIGLKDVDVDTAAGQLRVLGKRDKERIVPFGAELGEAIGHYRSVRDTVARHPERFFITARGGAVYPSLVYNVVHRALQQAGGTGKMSPHVLRHSFASAMLNGGARLSSVKELLGHESLAATQIYTHITASELKNNYKLAHPRALIRKGG